MNENTKSILRLIVQRLRGHAGGDALALGELTEFLSSPGTPTEDLQAAFDTILALTEPNCEEEFTGPPGARPVNRVLSEEERSRLTTEAYGFLLGARGDGSLDEEQFEWVLERALASGERPVGLDEIQDLMFEAACGGPDGFGGERGDFPRVH